MRHWIPPFALMACAILLQPMVARDPVLHVIVQMPILIAVGYFMPLPRDLLRPEWVMPIFLCSIFTVLIWMLPRSVDAALLTWMGHVAKFAMLPILIGLPLRLTWGRLDPVLRGFCKAQAVSMSLILAFLYTHSPLRICNSYLLEDQQRLGVAFFVVGIGLIVVWAVPIFLPFSLTYKKGKDHELPNLG